MSIAHIMSIPGPPRALFRMTPMEQSIEKQRPDQRLARRYHFNDPDMDLFFMAALGWGPAGGLDVGQAFYVASRIVDGDADSWVQAFGEYGDAQNAQADAWKQRGWTRAAGEARLKAFASYRSAWQFAVPGPQFAALYAKHQAAFVAAMGELGLPATFFEVPTRTSRCRASSCGTPIRTHPPRW